MALAQGKRPLFDFINTKRELVTGHGSTVAVSEDDTFKVASMDRAAGIVFTLPAPVPGLVYDLVATVSVTSNSYKIITSSASVFLIGAATILATGSTVFSADGTTHRAVTMNGTTTGGLRGSTIRFLCVSPTQWLVDGNLIGSGTQATPFTTS